MSKPKVVAKAKILQSDVDIVEYPGLYEKANCVGQWMGRELRIVYDPDAVNPSIVKIHEIIHGHRDALCLDDIPTIEDERATGLVESCICTFAKRNPKLSMELLRGIIGDKVWHRILKSMKP